MTTVAELIEQLKTMPQDSVVVCTFAFDDGVICGIDAPDAKSMHRMHDGTYYPCYDNCGFCKNYPEKEYPLVKVVTL